jgi:hypothetical protein
VIQAQHRTTGRCLLALALGALLWPAITLAQSASLHAAADSASLNDPLWQKAVAIAGRNLNWVPGSIYTRVEEVNDEGEAKHVQESWLRLFADTCGNVDSQILKAAEDGKDTTEQERQAAAEERRKELETRAKKEEQLAKRAQERGITVEELKQQEQSGQVAIRFGGPTPFDPGIQDSVFARRVTAADPPPGGPHVAFEFVQPISTKSKLRGIAWLDATTGTPVELRFSPDPLPGRVKEMSMRVRFATPSDSVWVPVAMDINALGKLLFFKKRFRSTMTFSDHWWKAGAG